MNSTVPDRIVEFAKENTHANRWIEDKTMSVYVRRGQHMINGSIRDCLDIANIEVKEKLRNKGIATELHKFLIGECNKLNLVLYIENILYEPWAVHLQKIGFEKVVGSFPKCLYFLPRGVV